MKTILLLLLVGVYLPACATMYSGRTERVSIVPDPSDAVVTVDAQTYHGAQTLDLDRSTPHMVRVEHPGFESGGATIQQNLNGLFWLNFLWGCAFPIGMYVDCHSGAMWNLDPDDLHLTLKPTSAQ